MTGIERVVGLLMELPDEARRHVWKELHRRGVSVMDDMLFQNPETAHAFARVFGSNDSRREAASKDPVFAKKYAFEVDKGPHDVTREGASKDPGIAYHYAEDIDKGPHEVTRQGASADALDALRYAFNIDDAPHDVTRKGAAREPLRALQYAQHLDKGPHRVTWQAVRGTEYEQDYARHFDVPEEWL